MIYRNLKLGVLSLFLALGLFGGVSLFNTEAASAQSLGGNGIFLPLVANGQAVENSTNPGPFDVAEAEAEAALYAKAIAEMEQNISVDEDGQLIYDGLVPLSADIAPELQQMLLDSLDETNRLLSMGELTLDDLEEPTVNDPSELMALGRCDGRNRVQRKWWGVKFYLDHCRTMALANGSTAVSIAGGCTIGALAGGVGAGPGCAFGGALGSFSNATIRAFDSWGGNDGIIIGKPWVGGGWIWYQ